MLRDEAELVAIELTSKQATRERDYAEDRLKLARGRYHLELIARRKAGEQLTIADMKAMEDCAIEDIPDVKAAYLNLMEKEAEADIKSIRWGSAEREYWDSRKSK